MFVWFFRNAPSYQHEQDAAYEQEAATFLNQLINELERTAINLPEDNVTGRIRLNESARNFRQLFSHNPSQLYSHLINCLQRERQCIAYPNECVNVQDPEIAEVINGLQELQMLVRVSENDNRNLVKDYEHLQLEIHEITKNKALLENLDNAALREHARTTLAQQERQVNEMVNLITGKRLQLVENFRKTIQLTSQVQEKVLHKYLTNWKINQGFAGNGASGMSASNLDTIQAWCESLAEIIWNTKDQIRLAMKNKQKLNIEEPNLPDFLPQSLVEVTNLLKALITTTFIIEKQPPQVMKTNTRFAATVRLLIGNTLNIRMSNPLVRVSIISGTSYDHSKFALVHRSSSSPHTNTSLLFFNARILSLLLFRGPSPGHATVQQGIGAVMRRDHEQHRQPRVQRNHQAVIG